MKRKNEANEESTKKPSVHLNQNLDCSMQKLKRVFINRGDDDEEDKEEEETLKRSEGNAKCNDPESELRTVKRIAEGLRPIKSASASQNKSKSENQKKSKNLKLKITSSASIKSSSSASTTSSMSKSLQSRLRRRRKRVQKISMTSSDESTTIDSSSINLKRKHDTTRNKSSSENDEDEDDSVSEDETENNLDKYIINEDFYRVTGAKEEEDKNRTFLSFAANSTCIFDEVFITEVTSGPLTVTIKESYSPEGFFKKREPCIK